jgi:integrase
VNKLHVTLHKALDQAVKWNMIPRKVSEAVKAPKPASKEMKTLSADQVRAMLSAAQGDRLEALYVLAVHTGMRQGELLALKWPDVDLRDGRVSIRRTITKGGGRLLLGKAVHPKFVQELLGHAHIAITLDTYSHIIRAMGDATARAMEDALEVDQLEV